MKKKRLAIFVFYDKYGFLDKSVEVFLAGLKQNTDEILFVANGEINSESEQTALKYAKRILKRPNKGYDAAAFKEGMTYLGENYLENFDEILHTNDSCYGPIYDFAEMFNTMDKKEIDFWGITKHSGGVLNWLKEFNEELIPEHIQTYFIAYRKNFFQSEQFKSFWQNLPEFENFNDAISNYELVLTRTFANQGFKWDTYVQSSDLYEYSANPICNLQTEILKRRCPVIKKRYFYEDYGNALIIDLGKSNWEAFNFIEKNTAFDTDIILENLLRTKDLSKIQKNLQLNYILPSSVKLNNKKSDKKIALFINGDLAENWIEYVNSMPKGAEIFEFSSFMELKETILSKDFDYICIAAGDKNEDQKPLKKGESLLYKGFENILKSEDFIQNVIHTFDSNPRLGILTPPVAFHSSFYPTLGHEWGGDFETCKKLCYELDLRAELNEKEFIGPLGSMFWFRKDSLKKLFSHKFKEEPPKKILEKLYSYAAQDSGYFTGWLLNDEYAKIELTNALYYLRNLNGAFNAQTDSRIFHRKMQECLSRGL